MGRDFRNGSYHRYVTVGKRTVKDGEAAVFWNINGVSREIVGPRLVRLFYSNVRFLNRHTATREQHLVVSHRNGEIEHIEGPRSMFENPVKHTSIRVVDSLYLETASHKIVVYSEMPIGIKLEAKDSEEGIQRSIISGPKRFMPEVNQSMHTFKWGNSFNFLDNRIIDTSEQQWELKVECLSRDSINATATLLISIAFVKVENLLLSKDPFAEMRNAINADLSAYGSKLTWDDMLTVFRDDIREKGTLAQLYDRADTIGVEVRNVLLKNIEADAKIMARVQSKRDADTKFEQERMRALELQKIEANQMEQRQKMEKIKLEAQSLLVESQQLLARKEKEHALQILKEENDAKALERERRNKETLDFLKEMKTMGVNLDTFLTANTMNQNNGKSIILDAPAMESVRSQITPPAPPDDLNQKRT
jgi:hypothetical protein